MRAAIRQTQWGSVPKVVGRVNMADRDELCFPKEEWCGFLASGMTQGQWSPMEKARVRVFGVPVCIVWSLCTE